MTSRNDQYRILDKLKAAPAANRKTALTKFIIGEITAVLETEDAVEPASRFEGLGIDSKYALEFKEYLEEELGCSLRTTLLFD